MTIAEKLQTIAENEPKVYDAGRTKGYNEGYADGTSGTAFETDSSIAYRKIVPSASEMYAQVLKVGGMSYKTTNLISSGYEPSKTLNGVKFTLGTDGSLTVNGTNTGETNANFRFSNKPLKAGTFTYSLCTKIPNGTFGGISLYDGQTWVRSIGIFSGDNGDTSMTFTITQEEASYSLAIGFTVKPGYTVSNLKLFPMVNEGTTALPYEPYFEGIRNAKVTELVSKGKNLFNPKQGVNSSFVDNGDGTYTITNSGGNDRFSDYIDLPIPAGTKVIIHSTKTGENIATTGLQFFGTDGIGDITTGLINGTLSLTPTKHIRRVRVYVQAGDVGKSATFSNIQIEYGDKATEYTPYVGTISTLEIPEALRNFLEQHGYGLGVDSTHYNYIDFDRKVFVQNVIKVAFDGTEDCYFDGDFDRADIPLPFRSKEGAKALCNKSYQNPNALYGAEQGFVVSGDYAYFTIGWWEDTEAFEAQLAQWKADGNPLTLVYVLYEPIEIDISEYLTGNLINVQGGGTIIPVNEFELAAPTAIQYIKKVGA